MSPFPLTSLWWESPPCLCRLSPLSMLLEFWALHRFPFCSLATVGDVALTGQHAWKQGHAVQHVGREKRARENRGGKLRRGMQLLALLMTAKRPTSVSDQWVQAAGAAHAQRISFKQVASTRKSHMNSCKGISGLCFTAVMASRTYCHSPTYDSHMHTQSIKTSGIFIHPYFCWYNYIWQNMNNYRQKSGRKDLNASGSWVKKFHLAVKTHEKAQSNAATRSLFSIKKPQDWNVEISLKDERPRGHVSPTSGIISHMAILTYKPK